MNPVPKKKRIVDKELKIKISGKPCQACRRYPPSDPHHVTTVGAGGDDVPENLIPLCRVCHQEWHKSGPTIMVKKYPSIMDWVVEMNRQDILNNNTGENPMNEASTSMEQKVKKEIRFNLTAEEKVKIADRAGTLSKERDIKTDELKTFNKNKKSELKDLQKEIDTLLENHVRGFEMRDVTCTEVLDWEEKTVTTYYKDKKVEEREMHDAELQMKLNNPTKKVSKKKKAKKATKVERNPDENLTPAELKKREIEEVRQSETRRNSKVSSIDEARKPYKED